MRIMATCLRSKAHTAGLHGNRWIFRTEGPPQTARPETGITKLGPVRLSVLAVRIWRGDSTVTIGTVLI